MLDLDPKCATKLTSLCFGNRLIPAGPRANEFARRDLLTVTNFNDFNGRPQTTNLGARSSNLFGRAI